LTAVVTPPAPRPDPAELRFRRPVEEDHPALLRAVEDWLGRRARTSLPRLWLRHFGGTSWLAETDAGRPVGLLVGFHSPDQPDEAIAHLVAVGPNVRRRGIGSVLYARFEADARAADRHRVVALVWPGDPGCVAFHRAIGFEAEAGPATQHLYGTPSIADYDGDGEDRAVLVKRV
jgi:GNAT superfamily N-acetyltransferase